MRLRSMVKILTCCLLLLTVFSSPAFGLSWTLPENISPQGEEVDKIFWLIFWLTTVTFFLTEGLLLYTVLVFRHREGRKASYTHGNHKLEVAWTLVPGVILFFLAVYQTGAWKRMKMDMPADDAEAVHVRVLAKQFEWWFWYAGKDGEFDTADDVWSDQSVLHIPKDKNIIVELRSKDVIHSFFLPHLRFKQDVMPGMSIKQWFLANKTTKEARDERQDQKFFYEIACAELCGANHFNMKGTLEILKPGEFDAWLVDRVEKDNRDDNIWSEWDKSYGHKKYPPRSSHGEHHGEEGVSMEHGH